MNRSVFDNLLAALYDYRTISSRLDELESSSDDEESTRNRKRHLRQRHITHLNTLKESLELLQDELTRQPADVISKWKMRHDSELRNLRYHLRHINDRRIRSLYDRIIVNHLGYRDSIEITTKVFDEFIKGITVFEKTFDNTARPQYHRNASCGARTMDKGLYKNTRSCKVSNTNKSLVRNKQLIFRCYLERMVYDALYTRYNLQFSGRGNTNSFQNQGHVNMLEDTRRDFESCHTNTTLKVDIGFIQNMPVRLEVTLLNMRTRRVISSETFLKSLQHDGGDITAYEHLFDPTVFCRKQEENGKMLYKTQTFEKPAVYSSTDTGFERRERETGLDFAFDSR
jgi:hypothetical protein